MLQATWEYIVQIFNVSPFVIIVTGILLVFAHWLVREATESVALSVIYTPFLLLGGLASNDFLTSHFIVLEQDSDSNTVLLITGGILASLLILLFSTRIVYTIRNNIRTARTHARQPNVT